MPRRLMISIHRVTRVIRNDYPRDEFLELEQAEIERLRSLPPGKDVGRSLGARGRNNRWLVIK